MSTPPFTEPLKVVTNSFEMKVPSEFRYFQYDGEHLSGFLLFVHSHLSSWLVDTANLLRQFKIILSRHEIAPESRTQNSDNQVDQDISRIAECCSPRTVQSANGLRREEASLLQGRAFQRDYRE